MKKLSPQLSELEIIDYADFFQIVLARSGYSLICSVNLKDQSRRALFTLELSLKDEVSPEGGRMAATSNVALNRIRSWRLLRSVASACARNDMPWAHPKLINIGE